MAMARRDLGNRRSRKSSGGQAPALMTRMEQKDVERGATPPITIVPNDNGVPIIRSQTPEISTAVNVELESGRHQHPHHRWRRSAYRRPRPRWRNRSCPASIPDSPNQDRSRPLALAEETVPTEQGQPESQPTRRNADAGNANHAQSATVREMLGDQVSAEDHVGSSTTSTLPPTQVDANQGPRIGRPMAKAIKMLAGMLGRKVVFTKPPTRKWRKASNRDGNTLYVNIDSNVDAVAVARA